MRILQLAQKPQRRGAEVFAYQLTRALQSSGHDARLLFLYAHDGAAPLPHDDAELLHGDERSPFDRAPGVDPRLVRRLLREIDRFRPDIVQANGARTVKYSAAVALARPNRTWSLVYRNIGDPRDWLHTSVHRAFYRRIVMPRLDGVVGVSETTLDAVRSVYGLSIPMRAIPAAVDPAALQPRQSRAELRAALRTPEDAPVLLSAGSLSAEKRPDRILRALHRLRTESPALQVWYAGDGPLLESLQAQAQSLGLTEAVRFLGVQEHMGDYLHAADLFVLTSDTEGMPAVLLEAGCAGLPVVATDVGGVAECVIEGETGMLIAPGDELALTEALALLLRNPLLRQRMGARAQEFVGDTFAVHRIAQRYASFYRELIDARPTSHIPPVRPTN